ncbi:hypothetical protein ANO11243_027560 [Dothideomycetidae sp. 11243]|nr:hypothetical protein ANO11243_027560 [fungal sp. No.11243]
MADDSSEADLNRLWLRAIARDGLPSADLDAARDIRTADDLAARIESSDLAFRNFRQRHGQLWSTLAKFVAPISLISKLAGSAANLTDFGTASSVVVGAVVYLIKACEGVSNAYDWIEQVFRGELQEFSDRLALYLKSPLDAALQNKMVAILAVVYKIIKRSDHLVRKGRFRQYLHVAFLGKDSETKSLITNLDRELVNEQRYVTAATYANTQAIDSTTTSTHNAVTALDEHVRKALETSDRAESDRSLKRALCETTAVDDVEETYFKNARALLKGTGDWLERQSCFQSWIQRQAPVLWLLGGPGTGKTFLSTWIIQYLMTRPHDVGTGDVVAYFFVKENNENLRDANVILETVAWQVAQRDPAFSSHAMQVCKQRVNILMPEDTWQNLFISYYMSPRAKDKTATVILDGLDEATPATRNTILQLLTSLTTSQGCTAPNLRFAVIGRPSLRSDGDFWRSQTQPTIEISKDSNRQDIEKYVKKRLEEVQVLREMRRVKPDGLKKANRFGAMILKKVSQGSDGVFLWAKLLMDSIVHKERHAIEAALVSAPPTLDVMTSSVFSRLANENMVDHDVLRKMLLIATYARRPLLFGELYAAIALPARSRNYLLWKVTRGVLSTIFDLRFPNWSDPGAAHPDDDVASEDGDEGASVTEDEPFDFSDDGIDSDEEYSYEAELGAGLSLHDHDGATKDMETSSKDVSHESDQLLEGLHMAQRETVITLCHVWIRDYIVREGNPDQRKHTALPIMPSAKDGEVDMTILCLDLFRTEPYSTKGEEFLTDYALSHLSSHLAAIDRAIVAREKTIQVVDGLYWLFGTSDGTKCLLKAARFADEYHQFRDTLFDLWVSEDRYLRLVQTWFGDVDTLLPHTQWDEPKVAWMRAASTSLKDLLRPAMLSASKIWLVRSSLDSVDHLEKGEFPCYLLHCWLEWCETGVRPTFRLKPVWVQDIKWRSSLTPARLESLANWAGFEHDANWYTYLGWAMIQGWHWEAAALRLLQAVQLEQNIWRALEGLAICCAGQNMAREAIAWQMQAVSAMPPALAAHSCMLLTRISEWSQIIGEHDLSAQAAVEAYKADKTSMHAVDRLLTVLNTHQQYDDVISILESLTQTFRDGYNLLVRFCWVQVYGYPEHIGRACRSQGQPRFVLDALDEARKVGLVQLEDGLQAVQAWWLASTKYNYYGLEKEAIPLYEAFLEACPRQDTVFHETTAAGQRGSVSLLSQLYFDQMIDEGVTDPTSRLSPTANKLRRMATSLDRTGMHDEVDGGYETDYPNKLWGRWLRDHVHADASVWKKCFRSRILEDLDRVHGSDQGVVVTSLAHLASALSHAGDRVNAGAILAILLAPFEENFKNTQAASSLTSRLSEGTSYLPGTTDSGTATPSDMIDVLKLPIEDQEQIVESTRRCDGCWQSPPKVAELYFCEVCFESTWCGSCLELLQGGKEQRLRLPRHLCNPAHEFYRAWPIPEEAKYVAAHSYENGIWVKREWLERLRCEWTE